MQDNTEIRTTKVIYPQIYAYTLPTVEDKDGWVKIGYTERQNVDIRIQEQIKTAAINLTYEKLWSGPAKFENSNGWFKDREFHAYLRKHKKIEQQPRKEWFLYGNNPELSLQHFHDFRRDPYNQATHEATYVLRDEQQAAVDQTLAYANNNSEGEFLWNAKPRFGKTLTTYDFIRQFDAQKVLIVTNRPAIANSWFDDFEKFIAWQTDYAFVSTSDSLKDRSPMTRDEFLDQYGSGKKRLLAFISLQDLKGAIAFGGNYDKLQWVKETSWDVLVIDEAHEGVATFKTDIAFDNIERKFTLHLSGTPFKALATGQFHQEQIYNWSYADEQNAKATWASTKGSNPYEQLPKLNLFSYQMSQMITDQVNRGANIEGENIDYAFDLNEFFDTDNNGKFVHEDEVKKWLNTLSQNEKYPFSTPELRNELKHTFWLLNRVASAKALQKLLKEHPVFENYHIILAAGDGRETDDDDQIINQKSLDRVKKAIKQHDKTITLSVGQLTTGVTIPEWTAVLMLSNIKSPSLYMQAAFRAQNPWAYLSGDQMRQKDNAYVFDFAPERTLIIYDDFANNLSYGTADGRGTTEDRKENIIQLLNFFPVIAEDSEGKMVELDVNQVLTIPKAIKAKEVVRRGFMSNLLFQNVSGIFASTEVREILEQLNPVDTGKVTPRKTNENIDTQGVQVDGDGEALVDDALVISTTEARFGEKVYGAVQASVEEASTQNKSLSNKAAAAFKQSATEAAKALAKEHGLTAKAAEQIVNQSAEAIAREVETVQRHSDIKKNEAEAECRRAIADAHHDEQKIAEAKAIFKDKTKQINEDFAREVVTAVERKTNEATKKTTEDILQRAEDKKKITVEDDVRARLRGFARTIPSFLMAYGEPNTTLANFDAHIKDEVFKEVTGITLEQFRLLRDTYKFFDETVFDHSVQEFLNKRKELANYFDENQDEDIFDYIPPQQTNQIFTPKRVVKMMVDKLEEENPGIFTDPNKTFADLYVKSGLYLTEIVKRLYVGLETHIPDDNQRLKHILENQVYGFAPSEIIYRIARNFIFGFDEKANRINDRHIVYLDTTPYAKGEGDFEAKYAELFGEKQ